MKNARRYGSSCRTLTSTLGTPLASCFAKSSLSAPAGSSWPLRPTHPVAIRSSSSRSRLSTVAWSIPSCWASRRRASTPPASIQPAVAGGVTLQAIQHYDELIATQCAQHEDYDLFAQLPGAGQTLAPRLLAAFGESRDRFASAQEIQRYSGVAPVTERSGNKTWVHWRLKAPTFLRQTLAEWAGQTITRSAWARAYYEQQRAKGKSHHVILRGLAFKWVRILFQCWTQRTPYDEARYLLRLRDKGSPLLQWLA